MNPLLLAALADRIATQLSGAAPGWRPEPVRGAPGAPIALAFRFTGGMPSYGPGLLEALALRLAAPYTAGGAAGGAPVVVAGPERPADAEVALRTETRDGVPGVGYELTLRDAGATFSGWVAPGAA